MLIVEGITCHCVEYLVKGGKYFFEKWIFFMRIAFIDLLEPLFEDPLKMFMVAIVPYMRRKS